MVSDHELIYDNIWPTLRSSGFCMLCPCLCQCNLSLILLLFVALNVSPHVVVDPCPISPSKFANWPSSLIQSIVTPCEPQTTNLVNVSTSYLLIYSSSSSFGIVIYCVLSSLVICPTLYLRSIIITIQVIWTNRPQSIQITFCICSVSVVTPIWQLSHLVRLLVFPGI